MILSLADVRDYIATLNISADNNTYSGKLADKKDKSIGVYNLKQGRPPITAIGGIENSSYNTKAISLLVHWNKSQRQTEEAANRLYEALTKCRNVTVNDKKILFVKHSYNEPISVDTDDKGIFEYVIECLFYYERNR